MFKYLLLLHNIQYLFVFTSKNALSSKHSSPKSPTHTSRSLVLDNKRT